MLGLGSRVQSQPPAPMTPEAVAPASAPVDPAPVSTPDEPAPASTAQAATPSGSETTHTVEAVEPEVDAERMAEAAAPVAGSDTIPAADFTQITGIGPKLSQRLLDAGVRTYADLGAHSAADVARILGWTEDRVVRVQIIEQAQSLAAGG
ncbi:MAG: hypothetical protein IPK16_03060 [Anaerolineales bacterium]|nr:hypothetical protein [Anaerolineales bacterium]